MEERLRLLCCLLRGYPHRGAEVAGDLFSLLCVVLLNDLEHGLGSRVIDDIWIAL